MIALAAVVPVRVVASVAAVVLVARVASVRVVAVFVVALRVPLAFGVMSAVLRGPARPSVVTMAGAGTCPLVRRRLTMAPRGRVVVVALRVARGRSRIVSHQAARSRARGWPEHVDDERRGDDARQGHAHESFQPCRVFPPPSSPSVARAVVAR